MSLGELTVQTSGPPVGLNTLSGEDKGSILAQALTDAFMNAISPLQNSLQKMVGLLQGILDVNVEHLNIVKGQIEGSEARAAEASAEGARSRGTGSVDGLEDAEDVDLSDAIKGSSLFKIIRASMLGLGLFFQDTIQGIIRSVKLPAIAKTLSNSLKFFTRGFVNLGATLKTLSSKFVGKGSPIGNFIQRIRDFFGKFPLLSKGLKLALKFIALPITVLFGIVDAVKGFMEGYKDGGIIDGVLTAIGNVLGGLIGAPLDLIKNIAAFVMEKLGFEGIAETMREFSFKDLIKNAFGGIVQFFENLPNMINSALRALPGGDFIANKLGLGTEEQKREAITGKKGQADIREEAIKQMTKEGTVEKERTFGIPNMKEYEDLTPDERRNVDLRVEELTRKKLEAEGLTETEKAVVPTERSIPGETTTEQLRELIKKKAIAPTGELAIEKEIVDGKVATVSAKGDVVIPEKKLGDLLNKEGAQNMAPIVAPTINKGGDNNSVTNISNVSGGSGGGGSYSMHNQDPSSFRLQSAQAEL